LLAPALWVLIIALSLNLGGAPVPRDFLHIVLTVGQVLILLVPLAMGPLVSAHGLRRPEVIASVVLRSGFGALVGFAPTILFGLNGTAAAIAIIGAAAPVGFTPSCYRHEKGST
jgi:predicted permease